MPKKPTHNPEAESRLEAIKGQFVWLVLAVVALWTAQNFIASFAAREMMASTDLWTAGEWNDALVLRAFEKAKEAAPNAKLETNPNGFHPERHDHLTVVALTKKEAVDGCEAAVQATRAAFAAEHGGDLQSNQESPRSDWVPNATTTDIKNGCRIASGLLLLFAVISVFVQFRRAHIPAIALLGVIVATFTVLTARHQTSHFARYGHKMTGLELLWIPFLGIGVPVGFLVLMIYVTRRVHKAAKWSEGHARITRSELALPSGRVHDEPDEPTVASIAYEYSVGSKNYTSSRIGIGVATAKYSAETVKDFPLGKEVPVYYDPENPEDAVLDRKPPVSLGCLWTGAIALLAAYAGIVAWMLT